MPYGVCDEHGDFIIFEYKIIDYIDDNVQIGAIALSVETCQQIKDPLLEVAIDGAL